jgi:hypothetical protein
MVVYRFRGKTWVGVWHLHSLKLLGIPPPRCRLALSSSSKSTLLGKVCYQPHVTLIQFILKEIFEKPKLDYDQTAMG